MPLTGTNKICQQCICTCKQWSQNKLLGCKLFISVQKNKPEKEGQLKTDIPFNLDGRAKEAQLEAIFDS